VDFELIAKPQTLARRRCLPEDEQVETRVIESLEQIFARTIRPKPQMHPRKSIAGTRRIRAYPVESL
jgi:hypothetical protein